MLNCRETISFSLVKYVAVMAAFSSAALAQIFSASAAPSCPTSCQPIQLVRAESVDNKGSVEIKVSWELAPLPSGLTISGFEVIAKASTKSGREREQRIQVGANLRTANIVLNDFLTGELKTFRARVVARFTANPPLITVIPTSETIVQSGRDTLLDLKWTVPASVQNLSPCVFTGYEITGSAIASDNRKLTGKDFVFDRSATSHKLRLDSGDVGRNPTFKRTEAQLKVIGGSAGGTECGVSSGEQSVGQGIANSTLSRNEIKAILEQETLLISVASNDTQVTVRFQISKSPLVRLDNAFVSASPIRQINAFDQSEIIGGNSLPPNQTQVNLTFSKEQISSNNPRGAVKEIAAVLRAKFLLPDGTSIEIIRRLNTPFNGSVGSTAAANNSNSSGNTTPKTGASGTPPAPPASSTPKASKKRN